MDLSKDLAAYGYGGVAWKERMESWKHKQEMHVARSDNVQHFWGFVSVCATLLGTMQHLFGQTRPVSVSRLTVKDTVDDKILNLQVTGIPVVFVSALEGQGRVAVMHQVEDTYQKWCLRLPTSRLNRWLIKVMSRHSWRDQAAQPKIKHFTQVKARPEDFVEQCINKAECLTLAIRKQSRELVAT